ncbi:MAG: DUF115 domain-containing protein [Magnetococcales bacterium]|nr:DUF115 domain-containing protein [Magnetococcales bacterium]
MIHWETNIPIIRQRWPNVWRLCCQASSRHRVEWVQDGTGVLVDGLRLFSQIDPWGEARLLADNVPTGSTTAFIYGLGGHHLPQTLLARPEITRLTVVLLNIGLFRQILEVMDHRTWLADPRTELLIWQEMDGVQKPFAAIPVALRLSGPEWAAKRWAARVRMSIEKEYSDRRFLEHPLLMEKIRQNKDVIQNDPGIDALFGTHPGGTILVAGAGPTLSDHFARLASRSQETPLIAVDGALIPLRQAGILPDVVVSLEHQPIVLTLFQDLQGDKALARVPLVYFPAADPSLLQEWPGPRYLACSASPIYEDIRQRRRQVVLHASGSVLHPAVDLAVRMGAAHVILAGADFSFPGGTSHVTGCPAMKWNVRVDPGTMLPDGQGGEVASSPALSCALLELEDYVRSHPEVVFFNLSRRGANIEGICHGDADSIVPLPDFAGKVPPLHFPVLHSFASMNIQSRLQQADTDLLVYRYTQAEASLFDLLERLTPDQDAGEQIAIQCGAASVCLHRNRSDQATKLATAALAMATSLPLSHQQGLALRILALRSLAQSHMQSGRYQESAGLLEETRSMTYALGDARQKARTGRVVAEFLRHHGRMRAARQQLLEVRAGLHLAEKQAKPLPLEDARCLMDLGNLTACSGSWSETREYFSQALEIFWNHQAKTAVAMARHALFTLRREMQQALQIHPDDCAGHLQQTIRFFRQGRDAEGGEAMQRFIDCVLWRLENKAGIDPEQINPLLARILDAQQRHDFVQVADDLAAQLVPIWPA